jgi:hypothetical protein
MPPTLQRREISQRISPKAYTSARLKESNWLVLMDSSSTCGNGGEPIKISLSLEEASFPHLWRHVTFGAHTMRRRYVNCIGGDIVTHGQSQIANSTAQIGFDQNVFGLQVTMGDRWFSWRKEKRSVY